MERQKSEVVALLSSTSRWLHDALQNEKNNVMVERLTIELMSRARNLIETINAEEITYQ